MQEKLSNQIRTLGVEKTFKLLGEKKNPYPYIKKCDYFCLLSEFEGYGMVLEEAKILNKNIIITDTAAREAVKEYENATVLPNNKTGIYEGLKKVIKLGSTNIENTKIKQYDNKEILKDIINVIEN